MSRNVSILVGVVLVFGMAAFVYWQVHDTRARIDATRAESTGEAGMTMASVAQHASGASCWTVINGSVYDLTSWIPEHPGGPQAILQLCGTDGSEKFNGKHGGKEPMVTILAGFKIGEIAQ